jgi:hypothetical protein
MKKIIMFFLGLVLTGCSTKIGFSPTVSHSGFDNSQVVNIVPHGTIPNSVFEIISISIGAQWNAAYSKDATLVVAVENEYTGITGVELNIDGEKMALTPIPGTTDMSSTSDATGGIIMRTSTRGFSITLESIERIIKSKRTWVRVYTPTGSLENAIIDGDKDSKAYNALIRFMNAVDANSH